jgi:hypothetical protein
MAQQKKGSGSGRVIQRGLKSIINSWTFGIGWIINVVLWILGDEQSIGEKITGIKVKNSGPLYGFMTLVQYFLSLFIIPLIIWIVFWILDKPSFAEMFSGASQ